MSVSQSLLVTEVSGSADIASNTSKVRILWQSTQSGDSWNGYTRIAKYYVSINGGAEKEYSVSYTLPRNATKTIVDTTITVPHNDDGTGSVRVRTWMDTSISAGVVEKTAAINLFNIPRASTISYVSDVVTLGNVCTVRWTPYSKNFYFKLEFWVGGWWHYEEFIHPNTTSLYTHASYSIPIEVAEKFPNSKDADMVVTLYTYSDAACTKNIGNASPVTCKVIIPEIGATLPNVVMSLSPVSTLSEQFNGLYIQNKTRVQARFTGSTAKYGASVVSCAMGVDWKTYYNEPYLSDVIAIYGTIPVYGTVTDTRGCSTSIGQNITVIPYSKPSLLPYTGESSIVCQRCDPNGNLSPSGTCLRIKAGRQYSKVMADGAQKNFCSIQFRYKTEGATSWISQKTILAEGDTADSVDAILTGINLSLSSTYIVQIEVIDTIGESYSTLITIPTADVTVHLRAGGKAIGVGKYAEQDNIVDIDDEWKLNVRGMLRANHIEAIDLYDGKDFNDLSTKTGYYNSASAPESVGCSNYPINLSGVLEVISGYGFAFQTYRTYNGIIYTRSYFVTIGWTEWKQVNFT